MKQQHAKSHSILQNSGGFLSADFLFAIVIACGLCMVFFCLTFTLSMVEVGQYIAYSVTRAHAAGHKTQDDQVAMARAKFASLQKNKGLNLLFSNGWFQVTNLDIRGGGQDRKDFTDRYPAAASNVASVPQIGVRLGFESKILKVQVPMLGSASNGGEGFKAFLSGLMIREPSAKECFDQIRKERYKAIMNLDKRFEKVAGSGSERDYVAMEDNGC